MSTVFTLTHPICLGGETLTSLSLRLPKGRDMRTILGAKNTGEGIHRLMADLAEVPPEVIDELGLSDWSKINNWLQEQLDPNGSRATSA